MKTIIKFGKEHSVEKTAEILKAKYGAKKFCNGMNVKRKIDKIGKIIEEYHREEQNIRQKQFIKEGGAKELICLIDGTYVHKWQKKGKNFEVIGIKVYNPENVVEISKGRKIIVKSHISGVLGTNKDYIEKEIKRCLLSEGWNYKTKVYFCADGEEKLWEIGKEKIINSEGILDWFHISKKMTEIFLWESEEKKAIWERIKEKLWVGKTEEAIEELEKITPKEETKKEKKIKDLIKYIEKNKKNIINYGENRKAEKPISSAIVESLIEQLVSPRLKKRQKMGWSRRTAEYLLQIRSCYLNNEENSFWDYYVKKSA